MNLIVINKKHLLMNNKKTLQIKKIINNQN